MSNNEAAIEAEIQAKGKTAPRLTPQQITDAIDSEHIFRVSDALTYMGIPHDGRTGAMTICVMVLKNGFIVTGESAAASVENFDAEIGAKIARENARNKIWPLEGYLLRNRLHEREVYEASPKTGAQIVA